MSVGRAASYSSEIEVENFATWGQGAEPSTTEPRRFRWNPRKFSKALESIEKGGARSFPLPIQGLFEAQQLYGPAVEQADRYLCPNWRECRSAFTSEKQLKSHRFHKQELEPQKEAIHIKTWKNAMLEGKLVSVERQVAEWITQDKHADLENNGEDSSSNRDVLQKEVNSTTYDLRNRRGQANDGFPSGGMGQLRTSGLSAYLEDDRDSELSLSMSVSGSENTFQTLGQPMAARSQVDEQAHSPPAASSYPPRVESPEEEAPVRASTATTMPASSEAEAVASEAKISTDPAVEWRSGMRKRLREASELKEQQAAKQAKLDDELEKATLATEEENAMRARDLADQEAELKMLRN